ncbi:hypothetical protein QBC44DRAFT_364973 [Cladorrhinum sp. PSN332]|nr:hypothetical protein QBC44DRAFT_364973 [Cladorrhinum sp. PSN332]
MPSSLKDRVTIALLCLCFSALVASTPAAPLSATSLGPKSKTVAKRIVIQQSPSYCERNWAYECGYTCYWNDWHINREITYRRCDAYATGRYSSRVICWYTVECSYQDSEGVVYCVSASPENFCQNQHFDFSCDGYNPQRRRVTQTDSEAMEDGNTNGDIGGGGGALSTEPEEEYVAASCNSRYIYKARVNLSEELEEVAKHRGNQTTGVPSSGGPFAERRTWRRAGDAQSANGKSEPQPTLHQNVKRGDCCRVYC